MPVQQPSGSCPHVVQCCLCLPQASAQKLVWLVVTAAAGAALRLKYFTRAPRCLSHAGGALQRGWTCKWLHKAEEVFKSTKGHLSSYLLATPLKISLSIAVTSQRSKASFSLEPAPHASFGSMECLLESHPPFQPRCCSLLAQGIMFNSGNFYYFSSEGSKFLSKTSQKYPAKVQNQNTLCKQPTSEIYWLFILLTATARRSPINNLDNVWGLERKALYE